MEGKIVNVNEFKAVGITYFGDNNNGEIPKLWDAFNKQWDSIKGKSNSMLCFGICDDMPDSEGKFHYTACAEVESFVQVPVGMEPKVVPSGKYALYNYKGELKELGEFYNDIYSKWLHESGHELDFRPQFELYDERYMKNGEFDVYIPIK